MSDSNLSPLEDKRTAIAILLCLIVVMVYSEYVMAPYTRQLPPQSNATQSASPSVSSEATQLPASSLSEQNSSQNISVASAQGANAIRTGYPTPLELSNAPANVIKTPLFTAKINTLGGRMESFKLARHKQSREGSDPYEMVSSLEGGGLPLGVFAGNLNDTFVNYTLIDSSRPSREDGLFEFNDSELTLTYRGKLSDQTEITKTFIFRADNYLFDVNVKLSRTTTDGSRIRLEWLHFIPDLKALNSYDYFGIARFTDGSISRTLIAEVAESGEVFGNDTWIELGNNYFAAVIIPTITGQNTIMTHRDNTFITRALGNSDGGEFKLYVGPKELGSLKPVGFDLHRSIDLGFFSALAHPLLDLLRFFYRVFGNYGLSIVLLTLFIKALFLPLTKKSFKSMAAMQELQPKVKALREKHAKDPTKMNQELMALYKKEGVNPMGGCLPMLIQLPVFLGLYNALLNSIELRHAPFALWINDLSSPESLQIFGIGIPVMVILMGISMFVQQWMTPTVMDPMQKKIMMFMPIVFTFFFIGFPAGLVLYWLVNNVVSIVQQAFIKREKAAGATRATVIASVAIFGFAYILTLV